MQASDVKLGLLLTVRVETFLLAGERRKRENVSFTRLRLRIRLSSRSSLASTDERGFSGVQFLNLALMFL